MHLIETFKDVLVKGRAIDVIYKDFKEIFEALKTK